MIVFLIIVLIVMITYLLINAHIKFENEILSQVGLDSWYEIEDADYYISVNNKIALEKYDDICLFKSHRDRLENAIDTVEQKIILKNKIQDFLQNNNYKKTAHYKTVEEQLQNVLNNLNGYVVAVSYGTIDERECLSKTKTITISMTRLQELKNRPDLFMTKSEYNQMIKKDSKEKLEEKKNIFYSRINDIICIADEKKDSLIIKRQINEIEVMLTALFGKTVNSIQKVKSIDSEEWTMLDNYIARIENDVMSIIRENEMLLEYYSSEDFKQIKNTCDKLMQSQREFNEYIDQKAKSISQLFGRRITRNETNNDDVFNYIRPYKKSITPFTVTVSAQVFGSAENNPMEYIIKYFYPDRSQYEKQIDNLRILIEELETLKEAKVIIENYKKEYAEYIEDVPSFVLELDEDGFYSRLGLATIDESVLEIEYRFEYTSDGGKAGRSFGVSMTEEMIAELINQLENKLTMVSQIREQRALMTQKLREYIKKRDNYTCCICGNSVEKEPNLLLEIDHIIPISKGGLTEESNLQTLCWKCNRAKSDKLQYQYN